MRLWTMPWKEDGKQKRKEEGGGREGGRAYLSPTTKLIFLPEAFSMAEIISSTLYPLPVPKLNTKQPPWCPRALA